MGLGGGDRLARGAKSAPFFTGTGDGEVELKNVSSEPREDIEIAPEQNVEKPKKVFPLGDRVLVRRNDVEQGMIVITETERPMEGTVLAVGKGRFENNQTI